MTFGAAIPILGAMKRSARKEIQADKRAMALQLRKDGNSYERVGILLGSQYNQDGSPFTLVYARTLVLDAIKDIYREDAKTLTKLELEKLDDLQLEALNVLRTEHVLVSNGAVIRTHVRDEHGKLEFDSETGLPKSVPIRDDGPTLAAIDRLLKIAERRSRLLGLDKPTKIASTDPDGKKSVGAVIMVSETDAKI